MKFIFGELNQGLVGTLGVVVFSALFVALLVWVYRRSGRAGYEQTALLPLKDETGREF